MILAATYEGIKEFAAATGRRVADLLALNEKNDPFYCGGPAQRRDAAWFVDIWEKYAFSASDSVHLRRIFYRIVNDPEPVRKPDGTVFHNTKEDWGYLEQASKAARNLRLVDPAAFVDRRNPDPVILAGVRYEPQCPSWSIEEPYFSLPYIAADFTCALSLPAPQVEGYSYELHDQRYHLVVMIEKSTQNDILEPICRRYAADLITGIGFQSITTAVNLLQRVNQYMKPVRIFYISDFDPAGDVMPVSTSRHLEYWQPVYAPGSEVKLCHLALTREQVIEHGLPRIPIKESDERKAGFQDRHGEGAVELDALEAIRPGELARIVEEAIEPYFDSDYEEDLSDAKAEAQEIAEEAWDEATAEIAADLADLEKRAVEIAKRYRKRFETLSKQFDGDMQPVRESLERLRQAALDKKSVLEIELPERPDPVWADADESDWLFDSSRSYEDQIEHYRWHKRSAS